ncbi:putative membrane protein [Gluconacetobacter diazotrophicus PA1 5]|uniref:Putative membrane protein n=1 Tax=Gluconacetobacter diazotrophicus (strain ATCC 49037 / DSM 5601 / CCUG 37298 / CIP 103539 / LMG 7603 / PAl5) TaxID=272568 RepID=A9HEW7_GLUDA|nr:putative membrane protein [Gluconacetobacter diazotrophicus PA1 5]
MMGRSIYADKVKVSLGVIVPLVLMIYAGPFPVKINSGLLLFDLVSIFAVCLVFYTLLKGGIDRSLKCVTRNAMGYCLCAFFMIMYRNGVISNGTLSGALAVSPLIGYVFSSCASRDHW